MSKHLPIYLFICLICGGLYYFCTSNLILSLLVFGLGLLALVVVAEPAIKRYEIKKDRTKECVWFISNFLITLSINQSLRLTFESLKESFSKSLLQQVKLNEHLDVETQIRSLSKYFNSDLYNVFLNLIDQYIYNGGEILKIAQILMFDTRKVGESVDNHTTLLLRKIVEFISLWVMTFLILVVMKFTLGEFYFKIAHNNDFYFGLLMFFFVFYANLTIFILNGFNLSFIKSTKIQKEKTLKQKKIRKEKKAHAKKVKSKNVKS